MEVAAILCRFEKTTSRLSKEFELAAYSLEKKLCLLWRSVQNPSYFRPRTFFGHIFQQELFPFACSAELQTGSGWTIRWYTVRFICAPLVPLHCIRHHSACAAILWWQVAPPIDWVCKQWTPVVASLVNCFRSWSTTTESDHHDRCRHFTWRHLHVIISHNASLSPSIPSLSLSLWPLPVLMDQMHQNRRIASLLSYLRPVIIAIVIIIRAK